MKTTFHYFKKLLLLTGCILMMASCNKYRKMNPPADADKPGGIGTDNTCYLATASNMLAGAGYGDGATLQARADDIYGEMKAQFGIASGGWTDVALTWWLGSSNNKWPNNPYKVVTVYGNKSPKNPWANANGTEFYGNKLRECCFVGLSISWPTAGASVGSGGHAITAWGDSFGKDALTINPTNVAVTDSDTDTGGDEQEYTYDTYTNPNPGGANEGNGWYFDYSNNHPYIKHIITLCPTDDPTDFTLTQKVTGSYKLTQTADIDATDLHYTVGTDVEILSYNTTLDWEAGSNPVITENGNPRKSITVDWNLIEKPVPPGTEVTITTEFVLPSWNSMKYSDVYWTYSEDGKNKPGLKLANINWLIETPQLRNLERLPNNVSGGFVVGSFNVVETLENGQEIISPYRFMHEYNYNQTPEQHLLQFSGRDSVTIRNLNLGHSWNALNASQLWEFKAWLTRSEEILYLSKEPTQVKIDWTGQVPYPEGEDINKAILKLNQNEKEER